MPVAFTIVCVWALPPLVLALLAAPGLAVMLGKCRSDADLAEAPATRLFAALLVGVFAALVAWSLGTVSPLAGRIAGLAWLGATPLICLASKKTLKRLVRFFWMNADAQAPMAMTAALATFSLGTALSSGLGTSGIAPSAFVDANPVAAAVSSLFMPFSEMAVYAAGASLQSTWVLAAWMCLRLWKVDGRLAATAIALTCASSFAFAPPGIFAWTKPLAGAAFVAGASVLLWAPREARQRWLAGAGFLLATLADPATVYPLLALIIAVPFFRGRVRPLGALRAVAPSLLVAMPRLLAWAAAAVESTPAEWLAHATANLAYLFEGFDPLHGLFSGSLAEARAAEVLHLANAFGLGGAFALTWPRARRALPARLATASGDALVIAGLAIVLYCVASPISRTAVAAAGPFGAYFIFFLGVSALIARLPPAAWALVVGVHVAGFLSLHVFAAGAPRGVEGWLLALCTWPAAAAILLAPWAAAPDERSLRVMAAAAEAEARVFLPLNR